MRRYLAQLGLSLRPGSVALIDTSLRHLADYLRAPRPCRLGRRHHSQSHRRVQDSDLLK